MASIAILLVAVVFAPVPGHSVWLSRVHDFAHGPIFGCVAVLTLVGLRRWPPFARWSWLRQYAIALGVASALGLLTEAAQIPAGRDASWLDLRHDVLGAVAVLALFALVDPVLRSRRSWTARGALLAIGVALLGFLAAPTLRAAVEYRDRRMSFPVIADFSSSVDLYFIWRIASIVEAAPTPEAVRRYPGEAGARVRFLPQRYAGVQFHEPFPDWRGFNTLAIDVANPTDRALPLVVRVHDAQHNDEYRDRYNRKFRLEPHKREILRVPLADVEGAPHGRRMDMAHIAGVVVFRVGETAADEMYLAKVWLE